MANTTVNQFDQCEPPVCPGDLRIDILNYSCASDTLIVTWVVFDNYNRNLIPLITFFPNSGASLIIATTFLFSEIIYCIIKE